MQILVLRTPRFNIVWKNSVEHFSQGLENSQEERDKSRDAKGTAKEYAMENENMEEQER